MMAFHSRTLPPLLPPQSPVPRYYDHYEWYSHPSSSATSFNQDPSPATDLASWHYPSYPPNNRTAAPVLPQASLFEPGAAKLPQYDGPAPPGLVHPNHSQSFSHLPSAPTVAEICGDDYFYDDPPQRSYTAGDLQQFHQQQDVQVAKAPQDSSAGGVSAHLDYDMDEMATFVTYQAQKLVFGSSNTVPGFRKFVSQVLTSTRLPSSTIILAMSYMRGRVNFYYNRGTFGFTEQDLYHFLTLALLLASKFLDDNTFQNKSWSEVTRIDVKTINALEIEWMIDNDWRLGLFDGHNLRLWQDWESLWDGHVANQKEEARLAQQARIASEELKAKQIMETMQIGSRRQSIPHIRVQPIPYTPDPWSHMYSSQNTPPSAPDTAPPTPEYWGSSSHADWGHTSGISISPYSTLPSSAYSSMSAKSTHNTPAPPSYDSATEFGIKHQFNPWHQPDCTCRPIHRSSAIYPSWSSTGQSQYHHSLLLGQG